MIGFSHAFLSVKSYIPDIPYYVCACVCVCVCVCACVYVCVCVCGGFIMHFIIT